MVRTPDAIIVSIIIFFLIGFAVGLTLSEKLRIDDQAPSEADSASYFEGIFDTCMAFSVKFGFDQTDDIFSKCEEITDEARKMELDKAAKTETRGERWKAIAPIEVQSEEV